MFISTILGLVLLAVFGKLVIGILFRPILLLRVILGFALLVILSVVALAISIGTTMRYATSHGTTNGQQWGPSVKVGPLGVEVNSGTGQHVSVSPFGVEVDGQTSGGTRKTWVHASRNVTTVQDQATATDPEIAEARNDEPVHVPAEAPAAKAAPAEPQRLLADHFDPDIYQSEGAAVRGVTNQIAKLLDSVTCEQKEPKIIAIRGRIGQSLTLEMMDILAKTFPSASVTDSNGPDKPNAETVILYVSREPRTEPDASAAGVKDARATQVLRIEAAGSEGEVARSAPFLDKPWVDNFDGFVSQNPHHNWIIALSRSPATSAGEAEQQAIEDAVTQIQPRVRARMSADAREALDWLLQRQIRSRLQDSGLIVDRFVQRFERPYGEIWQVGLLIDAVPKKIGSLADKCDRVLAVQQRSFRQTVLSIAGVIALVCVVYIFLNSLTKGYFVWTLRAAAIAIIAGGVFLVLLLSHNEPMVEGFLR